MTANPLTTVDSERRRGTVTVEMLHELADSLNRCDFVRESGKPYFVGRTPKGDGTIVHFLDR